MDNISDVFLASSEMRHFSFTLDHAHDGRETRALSLRPGPVRQGGSEDKKSKCGR